ncbi:MAG TPA: SDR family NAD(P)-dependent oxidoreductase, partial [Tepidisphaeraceae bacterium]|nr:SDR family NAD(P)-dependent oxidoreductase [Tepidisphaeraceae bacterium]
MVITGASSGIGLATARMAAGAGARVVLAARCDESLAEVEKQIIADG